MGSNMAECHPVGFQWVMEARLKGATVIHVDPRFTRTSANATLHVPIRAGSDLAFLGGIVSYILENDRWFGEYVRAYTNAATIVGDEFQDTEDLDGLFSGWDAGRDAYDPRSWQYRGQEVTAAAGRRRRGASASGPQGGLGAPHSHGVAERDETLQHRRSVFQLLKRHFSRYTPEVVESATGVPRESLLEVAE